MLSQPLVAALLLASSGVQASPKPPGPRCRCRPHEPCWPSAPQWKALNASLAGNLVAVTPVGQSCHDPTYDEAACKVAQNLTTNSVWRGTQPSTVQQPNWEALYPLDQTCFINSSRSIPCAQGRVPLFSAEVETASHVQAVVKFAKKHNVRLAIKNTGHCYLGRSSAPESLRIATHKMKSLDFVDDFTPSGGAGCKGKPKPEGPAVTIGAGVYLKELYRAVAARNRTVVAGLAHTVGPAGGYIQGGGHSPLGTFKGMASDNALEFQVVTADGDIVTANAYQHTDLFWALRGGGGGTFGVVLSVTVRTFPEVPLVFASLLVTSPDSDGLFETARAFHAALPSINDLGGAGYYYLIPAPGYSFFRVGLGVTNSTDEAALRAVFAPVVEAAAQAVGNASVEFSAGPIPESKYFILSAIPDEADATGDYTLLGSRLISRDFLASASGPERLDEAMRKISAVRPASSFIGHVVAGGQVARNAGIDSALNPAWRRTLTHLVIGSNWDANTGKAEVEKIKAQVTDEMVPLLKALEPDMGTYLNEANAYEKGFQQAFWGKNYARLYRIKQKLDPQGLFIARAGVGSEDWDAEGICRVK